MENEERLTLARREVCEICNGVLDGRIEVFPGLKNFFATLPQLIPPDDPEAEKILRIDAKTRHIIIGNDRTIWNLEALIIRNKDYYQTSEAYREEILELCRNLLQRFS